MMMDDLITGKGFADKEYSAEREKFTQQKSNLIAAMTHSCPADLFGKGGEQADASFTGTISLVACPSHAQWTVANGQGSHCNIITTKLDGYLEGPRSSIKPLEGGVNFSLTLVDNVELHWNANVKYIVTISGNKRSN